MNARDLARACGVLAVVSLPHIQRERGARDGPSGAAEGGSGMHALT